MSTSKPEATWPNVSGLPIDCVDYAKFLAAKIDSERAAITIRPSDLGTKARTRSKGTKLQTTRENAANSVSPEATMLEQLTSELESARDVLDRRQKNHKYQLAVSVWRGKYEIILIRASLEYRLGEMLGPSVIAQSDINPDSQFAELKNALSHRAPSSSGTAPIERLVKERAILKQLLPLLEGDR